jgi:hypothetical protein
MYLPNTNAYPQYLTSPYNHGEYHQKKHIRIWATVGTGFPTLSIYTPLITHQGSFFRRQKTEGLTLVGLFMEGTTLTCLETYSDAKKRTLLHSRGKKEPCYTPGEGSSSQTGITLQADVRHRPQDDAIDHAIPTSFTWD